MTTSIRIAGLNIQIEHCLDCPKLHPELYVYDGGKTDISVNVTYDDIEAERIKTEREYALEGLPVPRYSDSETLFSAIHRKIAERIPEFGGVVFHGSSVAVGDTAYLFTAVSGTGKTTHTRLWLRNIKDSYVVNGDKPILRLIGDDVYVCGTPWNGKEMLGSSECVKLSSIAILNRADDNSINAISFRDASTKMIAQTYRPADQEMLLKTLSIINEIGKRVRFYDLRCNMEDEAAIISYRGMCND